MTLNSTESGRRAGSATSWFVLLLIAIAVAVFFPLQYLGVSLESLARDEVGVASTYADRPKAVQFAFYVHIVGSGWALLVGGFQFSGALRQRYPRVHRWTGRSYVAAVLTGGAAALVLACFSSLAFLGFFGFGTLGVLWMWTTYRGYRSARDRDFASHQAWMIRSYALTYAAPTLRMWLILLTVIQLPFGVDAAVADANAYAPVPFLCWLPNIVVAEYLVYRRGLPSLLPLKRAPIR